MTRTLLPFAALVLLTACKSGDTVSNASSSNASSTDPSGRNASSPELSASGLNFELEPVSHASFVAFAKTPDDADIVLYNDPVGGAEAYASFPPADLVLVSDVHGDHLDTASLNAVVGEETKLVVPQAVKDLLPKRLAALARVLANGEAATVAGVVVEAVPMYNLREEAKQFHTPGRGNGYVLELSGQRVYVSGDTEDIPEMRALEDIDVALVCMNLPYTMDVEAAADAVGAFSPSIVVPYHFRGTQGLSDTAKFRSLVAEANADVRVLSMDWYPAQ